eukprot:1072834-Prorocentrum_minimum.AAC.1
MPRVISCSLSSRGQCCRCRRTIYSSYSKGPKGRAVGKSGELDKAVRKGEGSLGWWGGECILAVIGTGEPSDWPEPTGV